MNFLRLAYPSNVSVFRDCWLVISTPLTVAGSITLDIIFVSGILISVKLVCLRSTVCNRFNPDKSIEPDVDTSPFNVNLWIFGADITIPPGRNAGTLFFVSESTYITEGSAINSVSRFPFIVSVFAGVVDKLPKLPSER